METYDNLGGSVQTEKGGSLTMTSKGKGLHIEGSGVTNPLSGFTHHTTVSLDIDDKELIKSGKAKITKFSITTYSEVSIYGSGYTVNMHLEAANIPMVEDAVIYTHWEGRNNNGLFVLFWKESACLSTTTPPISLKSGSHSKMALLRVQE